METKPKDGMEKTKIGLWKPLVYSFRACYYGDWPLLDTQGHEFTDADSVDFKMRGKPLAGRYKFVPWVLKGDMDFAINHFEMPGHWSSGHPCPACPCVREDGSLNSWNNFGPLAVWKGFVFEDMLPYRQHCAFKGKVVHQIHEPLDNNGLGMHIKSSYKDSLHVVDLGVAMHIGGNVLYLLCYQNLPGSPSDNIAQVWGEVGEIYKARLTTSQFSLLSLNSFCDPRSPHADFPLLKGKGAEIRHVMPILWTIWRKHMKPDTEYDRHVERVLKHICKFYELLEYKNADGHYPFRLPAEVSTILIKSVDDLLTHYTHLAFVSVSADRKVMRWAVVPKHHYFWHLARESADINTRFTWCYANEDFVGKMAVIGTSTRHGLPAAYRSKAISGKYALGLALRLHHASAS